jgi:hypothetical protein
VDKYQNWLSAALAELEEDFSRQVFQPQNESDIQCHLYYTLLKTKSRIEGLASRHIVLSEFSSTSFSERIDLVIGSWKKREKLFEPRLLIEIKETSRGNLTADEVRERIKDDIYKLRRYSKMLEQNKMTRVLNNFRPPVIVFFFRGSGVHGIGTITDRDLKTLQQKYGDVSLWWGPAGSCYRKK